MNKLRGSGVSKRWQRALAALAVLFAICAPPVLSQTDAAAKDSNAQAASTPPPARTAPARPKLVVVLVVDQMRADYIDKFLGQWNGGLRRLVEEGAWFRDAAYPYAATETCVGHATISTGAFPATHGMVANAWWDRESQKMVTCTSDPNAKNIDYAGATAKGGDSAWRMDVPSFAEELKFQAGAGTRIVTLSLKARAAIALAGHKADAVTWFDSAEGAWETSSVYGAVPFVEDYAKAHPVKEDYGKTWSLSLPEAAYFYNEKALGAVPAEGWELTFPHPLRGKADSTEPDAAFYEQWSASPFADVYLTHLAETAMDNLGLGKSAATDYLGLSYSTLDYAGHAFGPRSWEVQDVLVRLDQDLADLFKHLDEKVGRGNYVVALSADHGVVPIPEDMKQTGADAGVLHLPDVQDRIEKALEPLNYPKPAVSRINGSDIYFAKGVYERLKGDSAAMNVVLAAIKSVDGVEGVYRAEDLAGRPATHSPLREAMAAGYSPLRSGDLFIVPKAYWLMDSTPTGQTRHYGTGHGTPWAYDQHVPVLLMGFGIKPGEYQGTITPADIAPTLASLCGITIAPRDGRVLGEALASTLTAPAKPANKKATTSDRPRVIKSPQTPEQYFHKQKDQKQN
ncbi:MAG TPA: alkaline phosphatase family protein [Candidatus Acidoferrum sp.]|nr:alkaline phosphatase family protein [Candidatus Acidoferrum sp.]